MPELYWISGSPPSWRVMLALTLKGVAYRSCRLDHASGANRSPEYLRLNPLGQVPTLRHGETVIRESIAILAYLDRAWPDRPIFGRDAAASARIWQQVMIFEATLRDPAGTVARMLLRGTLPQGRDAFDWASSATRSALEAVDAALADALFLADDRPSAADIWLFPLLGWLDRALDVTGAPPPAIATWEDDHPNLRAWRQRFAALPGITETYPPHWTEKTSTKMETAK